MHSLVCSTFMSLALYSGISIQEFPLGSGQVSLELMVQRLYEHFFQGDQSLCPLNVGVPSVELMVQIKII